MIITSSSRLLLSRTSLSTTRRYLARQSVIPPEVSATFGVRDDQRNYHQQQQSTSTVNDAEVAHFRSLSKHWWSGPEFAPLRSMNQLRVPFIARAFESAATNPHDLPLKGVKLLDIGSGGGILAEGLARLGADILGIDPVIENVEAARTHARLSFRDPTTAPKYESIRIEELATDPTRIDSFDGVIASEVLEHVDNIALFLESGLACLRPGGRLFVTTVNQTPLSYLTVILAAETLGIVPSGTHEYGKFVPPDSLKLLLEQDYGCSVGQVHGMFYNPLTGQWSWVQNQWVSYAMMAIKN